MKIKFLELFGGIGSPRRASLNIKMNGKYIDYVEWWGWAVAAYNLLFENKYKPQNILEWNLIVDILAHGTPCPDFSKAGKNDLSKGRSILYKRSLEIIENELKPKPKVVIWENVTNLIYQHEEHFNYYLYKMKKMGYQNYWRILNSKDFGIPQNRERIFVVSIRNDIKHNFNFDNLLKIPMRPLSEFLEEEVSDEFYVKKNSSFERHILKHLPGTINYIGKMKIIDSRDISSFVNCITTKQDRNANAGWILSKVKKDNFYQLFWRGEYWSLRALTPRECWRLMGWEDKEINKVINMPKTHLYHMAGNAIVIQVFEAILKEVLKIFD